jgi:hypothetical protein
MAELSQSQLEELVEGKPQKPRAVFYEKAALQVEESKQSGKRVYRTRVYVKMIQSGVTDNISYVARQSEIDEFPEEYAYFMQNRQGSSNAVLIDIIPNLNISNKQELIDMGLSTIDRLAGAVSVPPHLEHIRQSAIILQKVLQEQSHGHEEESIPETTQENVPTPHRQSDERIVERSDLQTSYKSGDGSVTGELLPSRQVHSRKKLSPLLDVNWSLDIG